MSLLAHIMKNEKHITLLQPLQKERAKLLAACRKEHKDFFKWNDWIAKHIEKYLNKIRTQKLDKISSAGKKIAQKTVLKASMAGR